jgi:hypothetical protein
VAIARILSALRPNSAIGSFGTGPFMDRHDRTLDALANPSSPISALTSSRAFAAAAAWAGGGPAGASLLTYPIADFGTSIFGAALRSVFSTALGRDSFVGEPGSLPHDASASESAPIAMTVLPFIP